MFHFVTRIDRIMLWLNIIFLMTIGFIPFSTALLGRYYTLQLPLVIYGANLIATSLTSQFLWIYAVKRKLLSSDLIDEKIMSKINTRLSLGPISYAVGIVVSFWNPLISLAIYIAVLAFFIVGTTFGTDWETGNQSNTEYYTISH